MDDSDLKQLPPSKIQRLNSSQIAALVRKHRKPFTVEQIEAMDPSQFVDLNPMVRESWEEKRRVGYELTVEELVDELDAEMLDDEASLREDTRSSGGEPDERK